MITKMITMIIMIIIIEITIMLTVIITMKLETFYTYSIFENIVFLVINYQTF